MLPWLQDTARRSPSDVDRYFDCGTCMKTTPEQARQSIGCGFAPPAPAGLHVQAWDHVGREKGVDERDEDGRARPQDMCPGYVCGLPEVIEVSRARLHWGKASLPMFTHGEPTDELVIAIEILEVESARLQDWAMKQSSKAD